MPYCENCGKELTADMKFCPSCGSPAGKTVKEEYTVQSDDLVKKIKELIHEGNVSKIIVKKENGETLLEMPLSVGVVGTILVPWMAAIGVIAALVTRCKIIVERREE